MTDTYRRLQVQLGDDGADAAVQLHKKGGTDGRMMRLLVGQHDQSARAAAAFHGRLRAVEGAVGAFTPTPTAIPGGVLYGAADWYRYLSTVAEQRSVESGATTEQAKQVTATRWHGSFARHVRNGGRRTLADAMEADPAVQRWRRMTDGDPCDFCAMLAGRGAVYLSEDTAQGPAAGYHDFCGCTPVAEFD